MSRAPRVFAVTCAVPPGADEQLRVEVAGRTVTAAGPGGFTHAFTLPPEAATQRLRWQVYADVLEVRVPYRSPVPR